MAMHQSSPESRALARRKREELPQRSRTWWVKLLGALGVALLFLVGASQLMLDARLQRASYQEHIIYLGPDTSASELREPLLRLFPEGGDQSLAAEATAAWLQRSITPGTPLESLSRLREVRVSAREVTRHPDSVEYARLLTQARAQGGKEKARAGKEETTDLVEAVPAFSTRQLQLLRPALAVRTPESVRGGVTTSTLLMLLGVLLPVGLWRVRRLRPDPWLLPIAVALSALGFTLMIGLRDPLREALLFEDFAQGILSGCLLFTIFSAVDWQASVLPRLSWVPLVGALLISALLLTFGTGPGVSDARVNLDLGVLVVQPVEAVKLLVLLFLAAWCARRWEFLRSLHVRSEVMPGLVRRLGVPRPRDLLPVALGVGLSLAFLFLQKDLGPALVLAWTFLGLYSLARSRIGLASAGMVALVLGCAGAWWLQTPGTVYRRIHMLLHPWDSLLPGADQLALGLWAVAAGGATGAGLGWGETARVPAAHTDFILAGVAEELGVVGLGLTLSLYGALIFRLLRTARRLESPWALFLLAGSGYMLLSQLVLIGGGVLGVFPLSGVTTPLLSYGKSSQLAVFALLGMCAGISGYDQRHLEARLQAETQQHSSSSPFAGGLRASVAVVGTLLSLLLLRAFWLGVVAADALMVHPLLALQAGGEVGFVPNPRLRAIAEEIPRGNILDKHGLPLASGDRGLLDTYQRELSLLGADPDAACPDRTRRCYPAGGLTFSLLGDIREQVNWAASNTSFIEKVYSQRLQGYDDGAEVVTVPLPDGSKSVELRRSYQALLPLWWHRTEQNGPEWREILERDRDVHLTLDLKLQHALSEALKSALSHVQQDRKTTELTRAAGVILDVETGAVLASVTLPYPQRLGTALRNLDPEAPELFDRARFGIYPPGSTFKMVTAMAALRKDPALEKKSYTCSLLPDGRAGAVLPGKRRPIRDDIKDRPHGKVELQYGIQVSCNAYFAQLATDGVQEAALLETASFFGINTAEPNTPESLRKSLDQVGFGQGTVVVTPLQVAEVAATIASGGVLVRATLLQDEAELRRLDAKGSPSADKERPKANPQAPRFGDRVLTAAHSRTLSEAMRMVVEGGTARSALGMLKLPVAGKTGTAEVEGSQGSHAWFMGFAPFLEPGAAAPEGLEHPMAFAILLENAGYGGRYAAPVVGQVLQAVLEDHKKTEEGAEQAPGQGPGGAAMEQTSGAPASGTAAGVPPARQPRAPVKDARPKSRADSAPPRKTR